MAVRDPSADVGARLFAALRPLVDDLGQEAAERCLPDLVHNMLSADGAQIAVLGADGHSVDRSLGVPTRDRHISAIADELIRESVPWPDNQEGLSDEAITSTCGSVELEFLLAPLRDPGGVVGVACVWARVDQRDIAVDREALNLLAPWLGGVLTGGLDTLADSRPRELSLEQMRRREMNATERERQRWARNLHDETLQALGVLRFGLASALDSSGTVSRRAITKAVDSLAEQIDSLRELIDDLRPAVLDQAGLGPAVLTLVERTRRDSGVRVDVRLALGEEAERLPAEVELMAYRVIQEALTNVVKHGQAETIRLALAVRPHILEVLVADDGRGFVLGTETQGSGLRGMAERVSLAHGTLEIRSRVGTGTTVEVCVPI